MAEVHGTCEPRFETVRAALASNFDAGLDVGASAAVVLDGELVVDLWGGTIDDAGTPVGSATRSSTSGRRPRR